MRVARFFKRKRVVLKKLIITHPDHGHLELETGPDIEREFEKIMKEGYGNRVPAIFHAEKVDITRFVRHRAPYRFSSSYRSSFPCDDTVASTGGASVAGNACSHSSVLPWP